MDNEDVLEELGLSEQEIERLYESKVIKKVPPKLNQSASINEPVAIRK
jgi:hypothetical protein